MGFRSVLRTDFRLLFAIFPALSALSPGRAEARTFEGFTLGAKAGVSLNNPYVFEAYTPGTFLVAVSPGLRLFENRLVLEGDIGISEDLYEHQIVDWYREAWWSRRDTLYTRSWSTEDEHERYRFFYSYKGVLNAGSWSFFAGQAVYVRFHHTRERGSTNYSYTTSAVDSLHPISSGPIRSDYWWGNGLVVPVYGIARRFGRWSLHLQGASVFSLQAFVGVNLNPVRAIGPHR